MTASSVSGPCRWMRSSRSAPAMGGGTLGSGGAMSAAFLGGIAGCGAEQEAEPVFGVVDDEDEGLTT